MLIGKTFSKIFLTHTHQGRHTHSNIECMNVTSSYTEVAVVHYNSDKHECSEIEKLNVIEKS